MKFSLRNKCLYRMTIEREVELQQYIEKSKFLNRLDEAFDFKCIHISRELLFHIKGLRTPKEVWDKFESLFGKQEKLRGHILDNELIALHPSNIRDISLVLLEIQSPNIAMKAMWNREEG